MGTESQDELHGALSSMHKYLADDEPLKGQIGEILDGLAAGTTTRRNVLAIAETIRDQIPTLKLRDEAFREFVTGYHTTMVDIIPELRAEAEEPEES